MNLKRGSLISSLSSLRSKILLIMKLRHHLCKWIIRNKVRIICSLFWMKWLWSINSNSRFKLSRILGFWIRWITFRTGWIVLRAIYRLIIRSLRCFSILSLSSTLIRHLSISNKATISNYQITTQCKPKTSKDSTK